MKNAHPQEFPLDGHFVCKKRIPSFWGLSIMPTLEHAQGGNLRKVPVRGSYGTTFCNAITTRFLFLRKETVFLAKILLYDKTKRRTRHAKIFSERRKWRQSLLLSSILRLTERPSHRPEVRAQACIRTDRHPHDVPSVPSDGEKYRVRP